MRVDTAIILCAGMGNRMGDYGNFLPKPLWPFFQTNLLGLQIQYLKSIGIKKIFINLHHQKKLISEFIKSNFPEISILPEEIILDVGGGIHSFLRQTEVRSKEIVLAINSDVFINIPKSSIEEFAQLIINNEAVSGLILKKVPRSENEGYTKVIVDKKNYLSSLVKSRDVKDNQYLTYVGCCLINNKSIKKVEGVSSFFESIADFKNKKVLSYETNKEFYDMGTLKRYYKIISSIWTERENKEEELVSFLKENNLFI